MQTLKRQLVHWLYAAETMLNKDILLSDIAWKGLHESTAIIMKNYLRKNLTHLVHNGKKLEEQLQNIKTEKEQLQLRKALLRYKQDYLKIETTIHFYADAINTRNSNQTAWMLKGCDILCNDCMEMFLSPMQKPMPPVITYLDKGAGAAIMKAGLRLWDGSMSPAALIKITFHNLRQPTALLHECGHQIAHILGWNKELSKTLYENLESKNKIVAKAFSGWSSEIAADAVALVTTGFAAVAALHDVVDGEGNAVFNYNDGDPHPISYLRVLLNCAMCTCLFGKGPWDSLALQWQQYHPLEECEDEATKSTIKSSIPLLNEIAKIILLQPQSAFSNKSIANYIDISKIAPATLGKLNEVYTSQSMNLNCSNLQMVGLTGYRIGIGLGDLKNDLDKMEAHLLKIGNQNLKYYSQN